MIRRTFFKLALGIVGVLGLPKSLIATIDQEAKREEMRRRQRFIDHARPIIERRMEVQTAEIPVWQARLSGMGGTSLDDDDLVHVMRATFTSNIRGAKMAVAVDTAPLQTVRRFAATGSLSLDAMRRNGLSSVIARLHWDERIAVR
jgi:hypothetical protein